MADARPRSFAATFTLVALALALPLVTLTVVAASWYVGSERARLTAIAHSTGERLRERIDRELAEMTAIARTLATSPLIDSVDTAGFEAQARTLTDQKTVTIALAELDGRQLVNTRAAPGQPLPTVRRQAIVEALLRTRMPVVSGRLVSGLTGRPIIGVCVPVIRDGMITKIVWVVVRIEHFEGLIAQAGIDSPYSSAILDGAGQVLAMTPGAPVRDAKPGDSAGPDAAATPEPETLAFRDGSKLADWTVVSGVDNAALEAPLHASLLLFGSIGLLFVGLGCWFAWRSALGIAKAAGALAAAAEAMGRGGIAALPDMVTREGVIVARALTKASHTLREQRAAIEAARASLESRVAERSRELEASRAHYRALADNVSDVILLRRQGSYAFSYVSPSSEKMFGWEPDDVHPDDLPAVMAVDEALGAGQTSASCLFRTKRRDGSWIWVECVSNRIAGAGPDEPDVVCVLRDVTARQNHADELRIARDIAELAQAKAENASRAKSEFLALMSHEIRTPLATIKGFTELLSDTSPLSAEQIRYVALVGDATSTMLTAVDDILDFAKVESGDLHLDERPFALAGALEAVASFARPVAARQGMTLGLALAPELPPFVMGDERRLRQIVLNLLNAILRSRRGGLITLSVQRHRDGLESGRLNLLVSASGGHAVAHQGGGIGLTIAQRLIGLMGGRLEMAAGAGEPSSYRFTLRLPSANAPALMVLKPDLDTKKRDPARLLLVEDHLINREIARTVLERAGHAVDVASNGAEAVAAVQTTIYDLVLMDVQMPVMDGLTATRRIRALQHPSRRVPIVAMTAEVLPDQVRDILGSGMNGHIAKPVDREKLCETVAAQLSCVMLLDGERAEPTPPPTVFDRAAYDGLNGTLGAEGAKAALRGFVALLDAAHADENALRTDSGAVAVGARRLGFLDLAAAHERLAVSSEGDHPRAAIDRCRIARELAARVLVELDGGTRDEAARVALL